LLVADWKIRALWPSDSLERLTDLIHRACAPHLAHGLRFVGTHQTPQVTAERIASGHAFVATVHDELIGTVTVRPPQPLSSAPLYRDPHTWSFSQLAVAPELKGRGLGRALHDAAVQFALQSGAQTMMLDTAEPAKGLIALYESWGYRIVGRADWRPKTNYESVLMSRALSS
jgi:ribosomal protein S18 acetylase RimI-like enzyme